MGLSLRSVLAGAWGRLTHSMVVWSCWILVRIGTCMSIIPNMLGNVIHELCRPRKNWDVFSLQELCTDPCTMDINILQQVGMAADICHDNGPQDLVTVCLCIQIVTYKMHLWPSSGTHACTFDYPTTTTMGHSVRSIDICKPLARHTVCHLPGTVKNGINPWRQQFSKSARSHRRSTNYSQVKTLVRITSMQISFCAEKLLHQLSGWLVSDDLASEEATCGGAGLRGRLVFTAKLSEMKVAE